MGLSKLISLSVVLAFLAVGTGNLPWVLKKLRKAQFVLIQDSMYRDDTQKLSL